MKQNYIKMNKVVLPAFLCCLGFSSFAQVNNGDFEEWNKAFFFHHPYTEFNTMSSNYDTYFDNGELGVTEVELGDNSVMRIQNLMSDEGVKPGYFIFGEEPTPMGETLYFEGGFEMTDLTATGISMDIKMDISAEKPGFVLVQFKSQGVPTGFGNHSTGTYVFPISGTEDWSNVEFEFTNPLDESIDQCVIAIASADLISNDSPFDESAFVEVDNIELIGSNTEIPNGEFEAWAYVKPMFIPNDIEVEIDPLNPSFEQSNDPYGGMLALKLMTTEKDGQVVSGTAFMGEVDDEGVITPTIEIQNDDIMLSFWYSQVSENNGDVSSAKVVFYNMEDELYTPVFEKTFELTNTSEYQLFEYPFQEELGAEALSATHMTIEFESSAVNGENTPQIGTSLLLDDVQLSTALGIMNHFNKPVHSSVLSYPNPTLGRVVFRFTSACTGYYRVYNQNGVFLQTVTYQNKKMVVHDLSQMPVGNYLFKFRDSNGLGSSQVVKL